MNAQLKDHISNLLNEANLNFLPVGGGDISKAYKIDTSSGSLFLKLNNAKNALTMFQAETYGLQIIQKSHTIKVPSVLHCGEFQGTAFIIMEFIESKSPSSEDFNNLGIQLGKLHECTSNYFGMDEDNFIGSLSQYNKPEADWTKFYIKQRLSPQLELAKQRGLLLDKHCPSEKTMTAILGELFLNVRPSLLHGDLWRGNYLISKNGIPYLIDPAIYYGHYEVDMAMSKLFGGFGDSFYKAHSQYFPISKETPDRIAIYQLYYLLVHLNLFGKSYQGSVVNILDNYF